MCALMMRMLLDCVDEAGLGFQDLQVFTPIRPRHTLIFSHEIVEKKNKVIADKWGIISSRDEAVNQRGELVLRFFGETLAERDPAKLAR